MSYLVNDPSSKMSRRTLRRNQTETETKLWQRLRSKQLDGFKFYRQFGIGSYILDFYCPQCRLAIELDGGQHTSDITRDEYRTDHLAQHDIEVIRFWNNQVLQNIDDVVKSIWERLIERKKSLE